MKVKFVYHPGSDWKKMPTSIEVKLENKILNLPYMPFIGMRMQLCDWHEVYKISEKEADELDELIHIDEKFAVADVYEIINCEAYPQYLECHLVLQYSKEYREIVKRRNKL
jgi:hypothetical protein